MTLFERPPSPRGYLLPLRGDLPPLELRREWTRLSLDKHLAPRCDTGDKPMPFRASSLFSVRRDAQTGTSYLRSHSHLVYVDDKPVFSGEKVDIRHGQCISFRRKDSAYVYVDNTGSETLLPSELRKQYLAAKCLGNGGFGKVYLLFEKGKNYQRRALKIVHLRYKNKQLNHLQRKDNILTTLKHPCLIRVYYNVQLDLQRFLVLEYTAGGDLTQLVNNSRKLTEGQSKLIFFQLAHAVQYLHDNNICHFNLKPENILLERNDPHTLIKITDFDLVKGQAGISALKTIASSIPYLAPEIIKEEYSCSNSADVWSMGVLLFFILTGALPFENSDEAALRRYEVEFPHAQWDGVPRHAQLLLQAMLKVKSTSRPSAEQVVECLWLRDEAMRKEASEITGLKGIECKTPKPGHRNVYIGMPPGRGHVYSEYVYLEGGSRPRLGQRCRTLVRLWARTIVYSIFLFTLLLAIYTVLK